MSKYDLIVCGGTFDLLHKGHKKFLQDILNQTNKVLLGITSDSYIAKFKDGQIERFDVRKSEVGSYLKSIGAEARAEIVSINLAYEPLLTSEFSPRAIAVTPQTLKTAIEINEKRKNIDLPPLEIIVIEMEKAENGNPISSTRIRNGEINRNGRLYVRNEWKGHNLVLPQNLRPILQKPFGKVLDSPPSGLDPLKTVTIGDITTKKFNGKNIGQFLSIIDFQVKREKKFDKLSDLGFEENIATIEVENPAGSIASQLFISVQKAFESKERHVILVKGEEDLSFLPVMLIAPLGFLVYYGQPTFAKASAGKPDEGLVEVLVTEENKDKVFELVSKFK